MKYTAISIGPIVRTLNMVYKPRQLWLASFLFSHLMERIMDGLPKDCKVISPARVEKTKNGVGLYPDRVFVEGGVDVDAINNVVKKYADDCGISRDYFNVMMATEEVPQEASPIEQLNNSLDRMELFSPAVDADIEDGVRILISGGDDDKQVRHKTNKLLSVAFDNPLSALRGSLEEYANPNDFKKPYKMSHHNYICIVQADGDNMGKIMSKAKHPKDISEALAKYGVEATKLISDYGGMPIYAGGDDLLFLAPVVSKDNGDYSIFDLIDDIDVQYEKINDVVSQNEPGMKALRTSLSYGVSITYYKYPLREAVAAARNLLFGVAKNVKDGEQKGRIAWNLFKHSGSSFKACFSKLDKELYDAFKQVVKNTCAGDEVIVSAVSHKIRANAGLLALWAGTDEVEYRNLHFFEKYMDYVEGSDTSENRYKQSVLNLLNCLLQKDRFEKLKKVNEDAIDEVAIMVYGMLRTAKFIKGEEARDE